MGVLSSGGALGSIDWVSPSVGIRVGISVRAGRALGTRVNGTEKRGSRDQFDRVPTILRALLFEYTFRTVRFRGRETSKSAGKISERVINYLYSLLQVGGRSAPVEVQVIHNPLQSAVKDSN